MMYTSEIVGVFKVGFVFKCYVLYLWEIDSLLTKKADSSITLHIYTTDVVDYLKMVTKEQFWHSAVKRTGNTDL